MNERVLLAGLFHETHTFLPGFTAASDFEIRRGGELLSAVGDGSPLAGAVETARQGGLILLPTVDYRATPGPTVEDALFEQFWQELAERASAELERGLDGIYLVLHGAMVSQGCHDVEGELLRRLRSLRGAGRVPICGVVDLHANFTPAMAELADGLVAYRENPHTDAHAAAVAGAQLLSRLIRTGERPTTVWRHSALIWPPTGTSTADDPMRSLEAAARRLEAANPEILAVNVLAGFAFADMPYTGASFTAITVGDPARAIEEVEALKQWAFDHRELGCRVDTPLEEVLPRLRQCAEGPVLLVEPSDNIGGGAPGDGTAVLRALIEHGVQPSAVAICDAEAAGQARAHAVGDLMRLAIGDKSGPLGPAPLELEVQLVSVSDGHFELEDPCSHLASMCGRSFHMGPCAVVRHRGVLVLLTSRRTPPFDLGQWRSQGIEPRGLKAIGVKAAVAHRRAYDPIAKASYTVDTPGPCSSNLRTFPYRHVRRPIFPLDEPG